MNFFKNFKNFKPINSISLYVNNSKILKQRVNKLKRWFNSEFREFSYEFIVYLNSPQSKFLKRAVLTIMIYSIIQIGRRTLLCDKSAILIKNQIYIELKDHQIEDLIPNPEDSQNIKKIQYSKDFSYY